jgi:curved DNA-binding protein CbpA
MANPYETLGVTPNASHDDIRQAYRKAAKETHPDLNPGKPEAEKRFKEINAAYDIVGDAEKRKRYDAGEIDETGAERQPERHFYREYAEADPNMRYRQRRETAAGQGTGAGDFDYDIFASLFRGRSEGGHFRTLPRTLAMRSRSIFWKRCMARARWRQCPTARRSTSPSRPGSTTGRCSVQGQGLPAPTAIREMRMSRSGDRARLQAPRA